jgi:transcription-repair coupling factor (superfamily II helicase)
MNPIRLMDTDLQLKAGDRHTWSGMLGSGTGLTVAEAALKHNGFSLLITTDTQEAEKLTDELKFFLNNTIEVAHFPDWETLAYDSFSPHQDIISDRLSILNKMVTSDQGIVVVPVTTLMHRLAPRQFLIGNSLVLDKGQQFDTNAMLVKLQAAAYRRVETVYEHGEYAVRGSIMDIFPTGSNRPYRIDLFDEEIDSLKTFDPETQISIAQVERIDLLPAREFPLDKKAISHFRDSWHQCFDVDARSCPMYQDVSSGVPSAGVEYYLPLFYERLETLIDYLPENTLIFAAQGGQRQGIYDSAGHFYSDVLARYENLRYDIERPLLPPEQLFIPVDELFGLLKQYPRIDITSESVDTASSRTHKTPASVKELPDLTVNDRSQQPLRNLQEFLNQSIGNILICAETTGRREVILEMFRNNHVPISNVDSWPEFMQIDSGSLNKLFITIAPLSRGLWLPDARLSLVTEPDLYGDRVLQQRRRDKLKQSATDLVIKSLTELTIGSAVVHIDHGVGKYLGLQTLTTEEQTNEFLAVAYQDDAKLYVPVSSLHLISRYSGNEDAAAPLDRLGSDSWQKAKRKAVEKIHDVAAELLNIYARREAKPGHAFPEPDSSYHQFAASFPFEETPDQEQAIEQVISDMIQPRAMDRLICGDVGFGKTEVAMRASFLAVQGDKQVAILVPTTLLAQQHFETFSDRFAESPVSIEVISRFRTKKEQEGVKKKCMAGTLDIVIGTHALIQDGLNFKDLGLLIIDEEHRFGVKQKDKLKSLRSEVDILTLTATPIPRTLNMAMSGMRDLSIIATPPAKRLSINTFVRQHQDGLVREAIQRELLRGGQVYYLHNEVKTIQNTAKKLLEQVPEARIAVGHGQLRERELERVMSDFYHKRTNVLVCTTIIETGIDIPSANTIIMDRADKFGLAQIHQLRGRVGRSHHQAYAWLLTPHKKAMTPDSVKRLEAISNADELGSGFILATHDLEIRGAGELLGDEQTGHIQKIGFTLFMEMLDRAVKAIRDGKTPNLDRPLGEGTEVNMHLPALIPEDYLPDVHNRLILYKRISNAENGDHLRELQVEMIDRFGLLPDATKNLFRVTELKLKAEQLGIKKLDAGLSGGRIVFTQDTPVNPFTVVNLVQSEPHRYRLSGANQLRFDEKLENVDTRFNKVHRLLDRLLEGDKISRAS